MSIGKKPVEGEIWAGPGGVRFEVLINAEHFVTADPLVVYREISAPHDAGAGAVAEKNPAYVCTLEAFLEFMRPTGTRVQDAAACGAAQAGTRAADAAACVAKSAEEEPAQPDDSASGAPEKVLTPEQAAFREAVFNRGARSSAADEGEAEPEFSEEEFIKNFFAVPDSSGQIAFINENWQHITDRVVDNISIGLDLSIRSGNIDDRLIDLVGCLQMRSRFEGKRNRLRGE